MFSGAGNGALRALAPDGTEGSLRAEIIIGLLSVLATILAALIQRSWNWRSRKFPRGGEALDFGAVHEATSFSVDHLLKVLDLRDSPGTPDRPGVAVLTDTYLVRREADRGNGLVSIYCTSGELEGECVSHPNGFVMGDVDSDHMRVNRAIAVDLSRLAQHTCMRVINRVTFTGAYDRTPTENFETHIDRPTRALTFVLLLSGDHPAVSVKGYRQVGRRHRVRADRQSGPVLLNNGTLVYWHIVPQKGEWLPAEARIRVEWSWRPVPGGHRPVERGTTSDET